MTRIDTRGTAARPSPAGRTILLAAAFALFAASSSGAAPSREALERESREAMESADPYMGDWEGVFRMRNKTSMTLAAQVIALGKGRYHANILPDFDKHVAPIATLEGQLEGNRVTFFGWGDVSAYCGPDWEGEIADGAFRGTVPARHGGAFELRKVVRISPTLGAAPPPGAVVLFDGASMDEWRFQRGSGEIEKKVDNGVMVISAGGGSIETKKRFLYYELHLEFRTPFKPTAREQGRGNSGVYCHGREIQVLDSYGLGGRDKECGGIYARVAPLVNMCAPPRQWQTYDVTIHKPEKEGDSLRMTVRHNGVVILDRLDLDRSSRPDAIRLQNHGNPVEYRNIWLVELP